MTDTAIDLPSPGAALAQAVAIAARGRTPDEDLGALLQLAVAAVRGDGGSVFVWDAEQGRLVVAASTSLSPEDAAALEASIEAEPAHPVAAAAHGQAPQFGVDGSWHGGGTAAALPLRIAHTGVEEPLGTLVISSGGAWSVTPGDASTLAAFADLVAITVDRSRLVAMAAERSEWMERVSHTDALTGLANARTLSRVLELEVARASRQGTDLSVVLFDVDGLAAANEAAGPAVGDDILREVAAVLAESVRLVDTVARWGGDEFLVVAPGPAGMTVAQRVLDAVATRPAIGGRSATVSAGVARFPSDGATSEELLAAAEAALGTAKATGPGALAAASAA